MGRWCDEPCPVWKGELCGLRACQDMAESCSCSVCCSRQSPVRNLQETNTVHHVEAAHEAWQWEASSMKASRGTSRRDPGFAAFMFHCRICHFIENFPKGKLEKSSCEYKGKSKCLTISSPM